MKKKLIYTPTFRVRQEEIKVLKTFDFGEQIYPFLEIVKEHDRARVNQKSFKDIHLNLINSINSKKVFVDLPLYLSNRKSVKSEVLSFVLRVINNWEERTNYINSLSNLSQKIIPVISSYRTFNNEASFLIEQYNSLKSKFKSIAIRLKHSEFEKEWETIKNLVSEKDFIIIDIDTINSMPNSPLFRDIVNKLSNFNVCHKIILRSAINPDIQNKTLSHDTVVYEADNYIIENYKNFGVDSFADYVGVKKDYLTAGGGISPGFIFFDAVENKYYGFTYNVRELADFENHIVPSVLRSQSVNRMTNSVIDFLSTENKGWTILNRIYDNLESGKSQAKFKRISMEHYIFSIKKLIEANSI